MSSFFGGICIDFGYGFGVGRQEYGESSLGYVSPSSDIWEFKTEKVASLRNNQVPMQIIIFNKYYLALS